MKKIILGITLMISILSFSQKKFGFFTGVKYTHFSEGFMKSLSINDEISIGYQIGGFYEFEISNSFSFRPKLAISQQGDRYATAFNGRVGLKNIDYKLTYLNSSLDIKFYKDDRGFILFGPQIGILTSTSKVSIDLGNPANFDYGLNLAFGLNFSKHIFTEIGIYQGLNTVISFTDTTTFPGKDIDAKNIHLNINIGYRL